ncbi:MAG: aerotolerance regulator BatA, partial [Deltaproteobacteria bacterium]|nr:aerotolerance regulator BatA [Deltaproteobacteria bacterium]
MPDWSHLEFSDPLLLLFGLLAPIVYLHARRLPASVTYSSLVLVDGAGRSLRARLSGLPALLFAFATVALSVALAGPRTGDSVSEVQREGIAIAMVVDRSGSMDARDFVRGDRSSSRLDVVKRIFHEFVSGGGAFGEGRPDDLIGLVVFARYADGLCPLPLDHGNLVAILDQVE